MPAADRGLTGRILALPGSQDLAQDDLRDLRSLDRGALEGFRYGDLAELVGGQARQGAIEGPDRRADRTDDDDIVLHFVTPSVSGWT